MRAPTTRAELRADRDNSNRLLDECRLERNGLQRIAAERAGVIERLEQALNRCRYAVAWSAADSWDGCHECRARLEWARSLDEKRLTADELAAVAKLFAPFSQQFEGPPPTEKTP